MTRENEAPGLPAVPPAAPAHGVFGSLVEAAVETWQSRELLTQLAMRDIRIRYKQAVMGFGWAILMPVMVVGAGLIVRLVVVRSTGANLEVQDFGAMAAKAVCWAFFSGAIGFGTASLTANVNLVSKVYFPREVLPLSSVAAQGFDSFIAVVALGVALPFLGLKVTAALLWLPVLALLLVALTSASALFLSCANLFFRDVKYIVQLFLTFGIFVTPVLFEPAMLGKTGAKVMMLNPLAPILEGVRLSLSGHNLLAPLTTVSAAGVVIPAWDPWYLGYAVLWSVLGLVGALLFFHKMEFTFAEFL